MTFQNLIPPHPQQFNKNWSTVRESNLVFMNGEKEEGVIGDDSATREPVQERYRTSMKCLQLSINQNLKKD